MAKMENTTFEPEGYTKPQLLAALKSAGSAQPTKTSKPNLIVAFEELKRGPRSTARNHLVRAKAEASGESAPQPEATASAATVTETSNGHSYGDLPPNMPTTALWMHVRGAKRGVHGDSVEVDGKTVRFTKRNGTVIETPARDVIAASGDEALVAAARA